jgi:site-specific recombinase XerD
MSVAVEPASGSVLTATIDRYLAQIAVSLRPSSVVSAACVLRRFAEFLADNHPEVIGAADIGRAHIESYKTWLAAGPGRGDKPAVNTIRHRLSTVRMFFERIIEWDWADAPARVPLFAGDIPKKDDLLPKFLDDPTFAAFMRATRSEPRPLTRLVVELLARTGMRVGELCALQADAVVTIGTTAWLRIPVGKLHNDRYIPLHPQLVELLDDWSTTSPTNTTGLLLVNEDGRPLNRHIVTRMLNRITKKAGIGHVHAHQLRHTLATQAINRGMSLEAIAALLGHRSLDMTMTYARIADRTVADEYFAVSAKVEALYHQPATLPADAEGPVMARLRREHHRMLGNGYCARPVELDCAFETICETCTYFATTIEFRPTIRRQQSDARRKNQTGRDQLFTKLLDGLDQDNRP